MKPKKYHGVIVPLVTPFQKNGEIDKDSVERLLNHVIDADTFPFVLGTTGECLSQSIEKRSEFINAAGPDGKPDSGLSAKPGDK